jgi:hypothetical protein
MNLCHKCGRREAVTADGCCGHCKQKETNMQKFALFNRRAVALNRILTGGVVRD